MSATPGRDVSAAEHRRRAVRRPWLPGCLAVHGLTSATVVELSYLVVEEMVEDVTVITISPWPAADGHGRLRFDDAGVGEVAVATAQLHDELYRGWLRRPPRIGDVFGAAVHRETLAAVGDGLWEHPLRRLLPEGVYDLTAEARTAAKLALYAARSDILEVSEARRNGLYARAARSQRPAPYRVLADASGDRRR